MTTTRLMNAGSDRKRRSFGSFTLLACLSFIVATVASILIISDQAIAQEEAAPKVKEADLPSPNFLTLRAMSLNGSQETRAPGFKTVIPTWLEAKQKEAREAASRIVMRFNSPIEADSAIEVEYGTEKAQAPLVGIVVDSDKSPSSISTADYRASRDRGVTLTYRVLSAPRNFGAYAVIIEHWTVNELDTTYLKSVVLPNIETFTEQRITIAGLLPGVNRFAFGIQLTDAKGVTSASESTSHLVLVDEVAAMGLAATGFTEASETLMKSGATAISASSFWGGGFTLTPAFSPDAISVKVERRGTRLFNTDALPAPVKADIDAQTLVGTWEEVASIKLPKAIEKTVVLADDMGLGVESEAASESEAGVMVTALGERRYRVDIIHLLRASSTLAPLTDNWEYRVTLNHPRFALPVDSVTFHMKASVDGAGTGTIEVIDEASKSLSRTSLPDSQDK